MRRAPVIELSAEEHTELQRTARSNRSSVREVFRARIVLLAAEGQENRAIAEQMHTRPDTVSKWRRRFAEQRMAGLIDRPGRGRKPHFGREVIERIVDDTVHRTPEQATHWSTRTMAKHAGVSHTTVQRIWHAHELKPHLVRTFSCPMTSTSWRSCATSSGFISTPRSTPWSCASMRNHKSRLSTAPSPDYR